MTDPITGKPSAVRAVTTFISADESKFERFGSMMEGAPEMKFKELRYTRVK